MDFFLFFIFFFLNFSTQEYQDGYGRQQPGPRSLQVPGVVPDDRPHTSGEAPSIALHMQNNLRK